MVERVFKRVFNEWKWITVKESGVGTMPKIIKIKHKAVKNSQIQIPDHVFNEGLTLDAIGLYIYLLSRKQKEVIKWDEYMYFTDLTNTDYIETKQLWYKPVAIG